MQSMTPEEFKADTPQGPAEEVPSHETPTAPTFGEPGEPAPSVAKRFSITQWIIGLVVVALLGYPLVRWAMDSGDRSPSTTAVAPSLRPLRRC